MRVGTIAALCFAACGLAGMAACGSSSSETAPTETQGDPDTGVPDASDAAPFAPAAHPPFPQVVNLGGPVLAAPKIVPVFFPGYDRRADILAFAPKLAASTYWTTTTSEYGVGGLSIAAPIDVSDPVAGTIYNSDIRAWLESRFDGTHPEFGSAPIEGAVYTLYYPSATTIWDGDSPDAGADAGAADPRRSCKAFNGYHSEARVGGVAVPYVVIAYCSSGASVLDYMTQVSSHEWVEAATDPFSKSQPAYAHVDDDHLIWDIETGTELADMCEDDADVFVKPADIGYTVPRTWSNAAAKAGTEPCVPAPSAPYVGAAPVLPDTIQVENVYTKGALVLAGESKTLEVDLFSSAPTDDWVVTPHAYEFDNAGALVKAVNVFTTLVPTSGNNGDKLMLTVHTNKSSPYGIALIALDSAGPTKRRWWAMIGN